MPAAFFDSVPRGQQRDTHLQISESYAGRSILIPVHVRRGQQNGPTVLVTAALHGDELNGTGAIRDLLSDSQWQLRAGTLVMVPVLNILGFERHSRYLPDRRDLNRCFPGIADGSMASRMAGRIFQKLVRPCDYVIDLHTAAVRRTNYPNLRADLQNPDCDALARVFGAGIILDGRGPKGSLRRSATDRGIPTVIVEGGEVWKMEPAVVGCMSRGILNVLRHLKMVDGQPDVPTRQTVINHTKWVRAERGGLIQLHVAPGDSVEQGQPIATNCDLLNNEQNVLVSPWNGVVIGISTLPAVQPGEPIVHVGRFDSQRKKRQFERRVQKDEIQRIAHDHLSTSVMVTIHDDTETDVPAADGNGSER